MQTANIKNTKKCAFCKYWYDPSNSYINPKSPKNNIWQYDEHAKCKCLAKNYEMRASAMCNKYMCKLEIM